MSLAPPLAGKITITSRYGKRAQVPGVKVDTTFHTGTDLRAAMGTPVLASADGVVYAKRQGGVYYGPRIFTSALSGNWLIVRYGTMYVVYPHLQSSKLPVGATVTQGQTIALSGNSGGVAPHLHIGVWFVKAGGWVSADPENYFNFTGKATTPATTTGDISMADAASIEAKIDGLRQHVDNLLTPGGEGKFSFDAAILSEVRALRGVVDQDSKDLDTALSIVRAVRESQITKDGYTYDAAILSLVQNLVSAVANIKTGGAVDQAAIDQIKATLGADVAADLAKRLAE